MKKIDSLLPVEKIASKIFLIRKEKVLLDSDLAELYGVETKALKQTVRRNLKRFPKDFMFQLTREEYRSLRSQIVTLKRGQHSKYLPYAFTEQGVAMLSGVLSSDRAIEVNITIMRTFVQLRKFLLSNHKLAQKLKELEKHTLIKFNKQQEQINLIFEAIQELVKEESKPRKAIEFTI